MTENRQINALTAKERFANRGNPWTFFRHQNETGRRITPTARFSPGQWAEMDRVVRDQSAATRLVRRENLRDAVFL